MYCSLMEIFLSFCICLFKILQIKKFWHLRVSYVWKIYIFVLLISHRYYKSEEYLWTFLPKLTMNFKLASLAFMSTSPLSLIWGLFMKKKWRGFWKKNDFIIRSVMWFVILKVKPVTWSWDRFEFDKVMIDGNQSTFIATFQWI